MHEHKHEVNWQQAREADWTSSEIKESKSWFEVVLGKNLMCGVFVCDHLFLSQDWLVSVKGK